MITWWTEGPGHAEVLAAQARRQGFERVIVAGGDGTLLEVVNGLWWERAGQLPGVGMVSLGMGCDYIRNFDVGHNLPEALAIALGESLISVNVGVCHLQNMGGRPMKRVFVNVLGLGYDANVVERMPRQRAHVHGRIIYLLSALQELVRLRCHRVRVEVDEDCFETDTVLFAVGLGQYFGGGMMITPNASPRDGSFQLVWGRDLSRMEVLRLLPKIYTGQHLYHPRVDSGYGRHLKITARPRAYVQAEGELIGQTPIEIELHPMALPFAARSMHMEKEAG
jgi:YegS/Rv2252/BmrU family lipid kinase